MRTVIVTGGSRGVGLGIARRLAGASYRVIAVARRETDELRDAAREAGALHFWPCDLADTMVLPGLVKDLRREFGPVYGLVNNAGIGTGGLLATMPTAQIEQLVRLNTVSPIVLTKQVVRGMMVDAGNPVRGGRIVNIASIVAASGFSGLSVYSATKASLVGFTKALAREVGRLGVTVNAVAPGFVDTAMTEDLEGAQRGQIIRRSALGRLADIDDVANAVEFLLGDAARNITGTVLTVDAGSTA